MYIHSEEKITGFLRISWINMNIFASLSKVAFFKIDHLHNIFEKKRLH